MIDNPIKAKERILYLPIYEQGWPVLKGLGVWKILA